MMDVATPLEPTPQPLAKSTRVGLFVFWGTATLLAAWLLWRRLQGALTLPEDRQLWRLVTLLGAALMVARLARRSLAVPMTVWERWLPTVAIALCVGLLAAWTPPWFALATVVIGWEVAWHWRMDPLHVPTSRTPTDQASDESIDESFGEQGLGEESFGEESFGEEGLGEDVQQKWIRSLSEEGGEQIWGLVRVPLTSGQRISVAHAVFCPPLRAEPEVEVYAVEGPDASVRATAVFAHGMRLEVRLAVAATAPVEVVVEVLAAAQDAGEIYPDS